MTWYAVHCVLRGLTDALPILWAGCSLMIGQYLINLLNHRWGK